MCLKFGPTFAEAAFEMSWQEAQRKKRILPRVSSEARTGMEKTAVKPKTTARDMNAARISLRNITI
jgi:hypothetical protein